MTPCPLPCKFDCEYEAQELDQRVEGCRYQELIYIPLRVMGVDFASDYDIPNEIYMKYMGKHHYLSNCTGRVPNPGVTP